MSMRSESFCINSILDVILCNVTNEVLKSYKAGQKNPQDKGSFQNIGRGATLWQ